jgi:nicotinamide riboside kinase
LKIVLTGPESSGKTTLASWIAMSYGMRLVHELARDYLLLQTNGYNENSVREIALLQMWEERTAEKISDLVVCDTDLLTILIWQSEKFGHYDVDLYSKWVNSRVDMYYLCSPDIPWEQDSLRENEHDRSRLFNIYEKMLCEHSKKFTLISGDFQTRKNEITQSLFLLLNRL